MQVKTSPRKINLFNVIYIDDSEADRLLAKETMPDIEVFSDTSVKQKDVDDADLIIVDTFMPNVAEIYNMIDRQRVILCSSIDYSDSKIVSSQHNPRNYPFITKPVTYSKLIKALIDG